MSETLPKPSKCRGKIYTNSSKELWVKIFKTSDKMYYDYVESCKDFGYVVDAMSDANTYTAFNNDGYKLSLNYSSDKIMSIHLYEPIKMNTIIWPVGEIGKILPVPKSNIGDILYEYENSFCAYIGNTSFDDYNEYVSACIKQGFNIDYNRNDNLFYADNADGWRVSISYEGFNIMKIDIHNNEKTKKKPAYPLRKPLLKQRQKQQRKQPLLKLPVLKRQSHKSLFMSLKLLMIHLTKLYILQIQAISIIGQDAER